VLIDAAALWVHVDEATLQPSRVPEDVAALLLESAAGRQVNARLILREDEFATGNTMIPLVWPLRFSDFDAVGHMNNAAYWEILEESLAGKSGLRAPLRAVVEHAVQIEEGQTVQRVLTTEQKDIEVLIKVDYKTHAAMWCGTNP
jgi:acyl-ACP thioesterase